MKLWKYILGAIAFIGGIFAVSASTQKKKEYDKKVKNNQDQIKAVKVKTRKAEKAKSETKKQITESKKKTTATKKQVKDTTTAKKTVKNFENKYRKKRPGRPKKKA